MTDEPLAPLVCFIIDVIIVSIRAGSATTVTLFLILGSECKRWKPPTKTLFRWVDCFHYITGAAGIKAGHGQT